MTQTPFLTFWRTFCPHLPLGTAIKLYRIRR